MGTLLASLPLPAPLLQARGEVGSGGVTETFLYYRSDPFIAEVIYSLEKLFLHYRHDVVAAEVIYLL